jgi:4,5-dihydroxyphthalate decarboxylase
VLSLAYGRNLRVAAILDEVVGVEGIEVVPSEVHMSELAWRQLRRTGDGVGEFDISELSLSSLLISVDRGDPEFVAVPVFPMRKFFHTGILVRADAGIERPEDLAGRRVGIPEYQQTGALWVRHALLHQFGVEAKDMEWWMGRSKHLSHGGATGFRVPDGVTMHYVPENDDLGSMLLRGELDALLMYIRNTLVDRSTADLDGDSRVRTLFPDPVTEGVRYFEHTGIFPINHVLTVRRRLVERYPWLPQNLYNAFAEAKRVGEARLRSDLQPYVVAGATTPLSRDAYPYGVRANVHVLDALRQGSFEQGLTSRPIGLEEAFVPGLLDL